MNTYEFGYGILGEPAVIENHHDYFYAYKLPKWWEPIRCQS